MAAAFKNFPSSPDHGRQPNGPPPPMLLLYPMRPSSPSTTRPWSSTYSDRSIWEYYPNTASCTPAVISKFCHVQWEHFSSTNPNPTCSIQIRHCCPARTNIGRPESQLEKQWQQQREERGQLDRPRERGDVVRKDHGQRDKQPCADADESSDKVSAANWVLMPNDTPCVASKSQDGLWTPRPVPKEHSQNQNYLPFMQAGYGLHPPIPNPPWNPPSPVGESDTCPSSSCGAGQAVPSKWVVDWKVPNKADQKALPVSTPKWNWLTAKSMTDLRNTAFNNHPNNLQPGQRRSNELLVTKPPECREGILISIPSNMHGDGPSRMGTSWTLLIFLLCPNWATSNTTQASSQAWLLILTDHTQLQSISTTLIWHVSTAPPVSSHQWFYRFHFASWWPISSTTISLWQFHAFKAISQLPPYQWQWGQWYSSLTTSAEIGTWLLFPSFTPLRVLFTSVPHLIRQLLLALLRYSLWWPALPTLSTIQTNNSEFSIPNCAPHFAQCVVHSPQHISRHLRHEQLLYCIMAAVTAPLLCSPALFVCFQKFVFAPTDCLNYYRILATS